MYKTEKEKMLNGLLYDPSDPALKQDSINAKKLIYEYNHTRPDESDKRTEILKRLLGSIEGNVYIEPSFYCDYGYNISVGNNFYANTGCIILDVNKVTIGENVLLGPNVQIYSATHPTEPLARLTFKEFGKPVTIGNNVWIGGGSIICPGITIGDNCTIGAGSVVAKDIPANVLAVGNPCRVVRAV